MSSLEKVLEEWAKDCKIDRLDLEGTSVATPELHAKYLGMLQHAKLRVSQAEFDQKKLMMQKWLWFKGKLSQDEIMKYGWKPDPFDGLKVLNSDLEKFVEADEDLIKSEAKIIYLKSVVDALKDIVDTIRWRHQTIKNIIENKKFEAGF